MKLEDKINKLRISGVNIELIDNKSVALESVPDRIKYLVIPEGVEVLRSKWDSVDITQDNNTLEKVILPCSIKEIGDYTFYKYRNMSHVDNIEKVVRAGTQAFYFSSLSGELKLDNIESIDTLGFACTRINKLDIKESKLEYIENKAFFGCIELEEVHGLNNIVEIGTEAFSNCSKLTNITGTENIKRIMSGAFEFCTVLKELRLDNIQHISRGVFEGCENLTLIFPKRRESEIYDIIDIDSTKLVLISYPSVKVKFV